MRSTFKRPNRLRLPIHLLDAGNKTYCGIKFHRPKFRSNDTTTMDVWVTCEKCAGARAERLKSNVDQDAPDAGNLAERMRTSDHAPRERVIDFVAS